VPNHDDRFWKGILFWSTLCVLPVALIACINATLSLRSVFGSILASIILLAFAGVLFNLLRGSK
jgi:hypothetical protein